MTEQNIYKLKLHESFWCPEIEARIVRVAGGWIYKYYSYLPTITNIYAHDWQLISTCFVPFDNEYWIKK